MTWNATPFETMEQAHETALKYELNPSPVVVKDGFRSFTTTEGGKVFLIAQAVTGGPVREQEFKKRGKDRYRPPKQEGPSFSDADRLVVGPWLQVGEYQTLQDVEDHWRRQFVNFDNVEVFTMKLYRIDKDEYEYYFDGEDVWCRVLHKKGI